MIQGLGLGSYDYGWGYRELKRLHMMIQWLRLIITFHESDN